jgi:hypothetical protein
MNLLLLLLVHLLGFALSAKSAKVKVKISQTNTPHPIPSFNTPHPIPSARPIQQNAPLYPCELITVPVAAQSSESSIKFECSESDVSQYVYDFLVNNNNGDRLNIYTTDGLDCNKNPNDSDFEYYDESSIIASENAQLLGTNSPCLNGPPCCIFVYCDNSLLFSCAEKDVSTHWKEIPTPSPSPSPTPDAPSPSPSPTPNAEPQLVCVLSAVSIPVLNSGTGYANFDCNTKKVIAYQWSLEVSNPKQFYIAAYSTLGKYCAMNPRDADFKFVHSDSKGYSLLGDNSQVVAVYGGSCYGVTLSDAQNQNQELGIDQPCCTIILCGSDNLFDCSDLKITKVYYTPSPTPSPSPSSLPGSSASPTPSTTPISPGPSGSCDLVTGISAALTNTFDYKPWLCNSDDIIGGSLDLTVYNTAKDRLSVFATSGSFCSMSPNDPAFKSEARQLDSQENKIQFTGIPCQSSPCCTFIVCMNVIGYPCSPTFDSSYHKTNQMSSAAAAAISIGVIAGGVAGGVFLLACSAALGWRFIMGRKNAQSAEMQPILMMQPQHAPQYSQPQYAQQYSQQYYSNSA